jgi:Putative  PD-(D/E)XK family member, (DUF4420)
LFRSGAEAIVSTDLYELFASLVLPLERPAGRSLSAVAIPGAGRHRLAKDSGGSPCLLLRQPISATPTPPIRLQNLLVSYGIPIIKCSSADPSLFPHFLRILSPIITTLGPTPTAAAVRRAISGLVDLFQALTAPAKKSIQGLWAELLVIREASDPAALVAAWHGLPTERIDFLRGQQRIEVKSSSSRVRVHHFSLEQLTPPASTRLIIASIFVEPVGGGLSLRRLYDDIRAILAADPVLLTQFDSIFYATLGASWSDAMEECFDLELATESLKFFDSADIPKLDGPIPANVSDIRFTSDISGALPVSVDALMTGGGLFAAAVPAG